MKNKTYATDINSHGAYRMIDAALSLPEQSDRVLALRDALRASGDREAMVAAMINRLAGRGAP